MKLLGVNGAGGMIRGVHGSAGLSAEEPLRGAGRVYSVTVTSPAAAAVTVTMPVRVAVTIKVRMRAASRISVIGLRCAGRSRRGIACIALPFIVSPIKGVAMTMPRPPSCTQEEVHAVYDLRRK